MKKNKKNKKLTHKMFEDGIAGMFLFLLTTAAMILFMNGFMDYLERW